jgi:phage-related protein
MQAAKENGSVFFLDLYTFHLKNGDLFIVAADQNVTFAGQEYLAVPIKREKYSADVESTVSDVKLTVSDFSHDFIAALFNGYDFRGCKVEIIQIAYPQSLSNATIYKPFLFGYLDEPKLNWKDATFEVTIKAQIPNLENARTLKLSCNAEYADQESCFASLDETTGTCQDGTTVYTIVLEQSYDDNYWANGIVTCNWENRLIESSIGNTVTVRYPFSTVPSGDYTVERGCDKSWTGCGLKGQQTNFSGFIGIPRELVIRSS